jgi:hypothetical protein
MNVTEWEESLARDPLALRLSHIDHPPASQALRARVLSGARALRARRIRGGHVLLAAAGVIIALSAVAATPAGSAARSALGQRFGVMVVGPAASQKPEANDCVIYKGPSGISPNTTVTTFTRNGMTFTKMTRKCRKGGSITSVGFSPPLLDLQQAQGLISFRIRTATWAPAGMQLRGVYVYPKSPDFTNYNPDDASVTYGHLGTSSGPVVSIDEQRGTPFGGSAVPSSAARTVRVNGRPAVYAHGNWIPSSIPGAPPTRWNPNVDREELSWQADGMTFDISAEGLHLSERDMIRIADSIR